MMVVGAMELGTGAIRVTRNPTICSGVCRSSEFLQQQPFAATSSAWMLASKDAYDSRCRLIVIAASKQSRMRTGGKKSRAPSSPGWTRLRTHFVIQNPPSGFFLTPPSDVSMLYAPTVGIDWGGGELDVANTVETPTSSRTQPEQLVQDGENSAVTLPTAKRNDVLKACVNTSGALAIAGIAIRQTTHWASARGWSTPDCSVLMPYGFEVWHLGVTAGVVVLIASLRQGLLSVWPEFSKSSQASNQQVLSSLEPLDYIVVSFLPGISEELLFRGALLPLVGVDWRGVAASGLVFGILHISGGRNVAFATWASFVGIVYGLASVSTSNLAVPMLAHSLANLIAASLWRLNRIDNTKDT